MLLTISISFQGPIYQLQSCNMAHMPCRCWQNSPFLSRIIHLVSLTSNTVQPVVEATGDLMVPYFVDVADVAKAHILAAVKPQARGRYILALEDKFTPEVLPVSGCQIQDQGHARCSQVFQVLLPDHRLPEPKPCWDVGGLYNHVKCFARV